jgi:hypothetical protein
MIVNWKGFGRKQSCAIRNIFWHSPKMAAESHENINQAVSQLKFESSTTQTRANTSVQRDRYASALCQLM